MGSVEKSLIKFLIVAAALLFGAVLSLHFFPIECAYATEEYIHPSEMDFSDAGANPLIGYALLAALLLATIPSIVYPFKTKEQRQLQSSESIEIEDETARIINSDKEALEKARKVARPTPVILLITAIMNISAVICLSATVPSYPINITNFWMILFSGAGATATYSMYFLMKSAHVLIFPDGKIWYRTHMSLKPDEFYAKDIDFIEERKIDYRLHLKDGKIKKLYWLSSSLELKEYLIEQGIPTKDNG